MLRQCLQMACILLSFALSSTLLFAQMENEWAKWDSAEGSMFYLAGDDEITVGGISFLNTGGVYLDPYGRRQNLQNCYDLRARRGPIFIEARVIDGERKDRYFIFIAEKPAGFPTVVPVKRYLDQVVTSLKKIPETSRGVSAKVPIIITIAVAGTVFVALLAYFTSRRLRRNSIPRGSHFAETDYEINTDYTLVQPKTTTKHVIIVVLAILLTILVGFAILYISGD